MRLVGKGWGRFGLAGAMLLLWCAALTGCNGFFVCQKASCPTSTTGTTTTNTGDYAYVSNTTSSTSSIAAYNVASGALTAISGSPFSLGYVPLAMVVSPNNSFLYAGSGNGGIFLYTIASSGALSGSGTASVTTLLGSISSMDISPDGAFLFALDQTGTSLSEYQLNTSTGALTLSNSFNVPGLNSGCAPSGTPVSQSCSVKVSPISNGSGFVAVALGTSGTVVFPYTTSQGITSATNYGSIACCNSVVVAPSGDFSVAFDSNDYLYIARTLTLSSYGSVNTTAPVNAGNITFGGGVTPRAVTISKNGSYLYTANKGAGTISGFTLTGAGGLSALSGNSFAGPTNVAALGVDNSGSYLLAAGYDASTGVQLYKPTSGVPGSAVASAGTGTDTTFPVLVAMTH